MDLLGTLEQSGLGVALSNEQELPRPIKAHPALCREPTGRESGNMNQGVTEFARQFSSVPGKESSRGLPNLSWVRHPSQANRASLLLIAKSQTQADKADREGGTGLY